MKHLKRSLSIMAAVFLASTTLAWAEAAAAARDRRGALREQAARLVRLDDVSQCGHCRQIRDGRVAPRVGRDMDDPYREDDRAEKSRRRATDAIEKLSEARGLAETRLAIGAGDLLTDALLSEATRELRLSSDILGGPGVKERIASCFAEIERAEGLAIKRGTGLLASVGSTGPFVGLFGTVWGIMNSFIGISKAQTTNLAIVAPGIAEALLATAIGLLAAIPAVLIYNHLARSTGSYLELVSNVSGELLRIVSRDLDRGGHVSSNIHAAE